MKKFVILLCIIFNLCAVSALPPSQNIVDQYVAVALYAEVKDLKGKSSKWNCRFPIMYESLSASGKDQEDASLHLQLLCIKEQCQQLGDKVAKEVDNLQILPEQEFRDLLEFSGRSADEIEATMLTRKNYSASNTVTLTCKNSTQFRMIAFDSCFSPPMECQHKSFF